MINWFEIYTSDFDRAKKFYATVFNCELTDLPMGNDRHADMRYATFPADGKGGVSGALVKIEQAKPGYGGILVYFASEEINTELSRVEAAGGKILRPKTNVGEFGFIALIEDTEGNLIGLHSVK
ncbi:MAG: VOC family protein [Bacteroidetes bacterium]|nr:VOC family protein [Bacteroidota bacterium]